MQYSIAKKLGPLGLDCVLIESVINEWSVLFPGSISVSRVFVQRLLLIRKKSSRHCMSGFLLLQVNLLVSGC